MAGPAHITQALPASRPDAPPLAPATLMPRPPPPAAHAAAAAPQATIASTRSPTPADATEITEATRPPGQAMPAVRAAAEAAALAVEPVAQAARLATIANMAVGLAGAQARSRHRGRRHGVALMQDIDERLESAQCALSEWRKTGATADEARSLTVHSHWSCATENEELFSERGVACDAMRKL